MAEVTTSGVKKEETMKVEEKESGVCVCNEPATAPLTMLACSECNKWFHIHCVIPEAADPTLLTKYICKDCEVKTGSHSKWRKKKRKQDESMEQQHHDTLDTHEKKEHGDHKKMIINASPSSSAVKKQQQQQQQQLQQQQQQQQQEPVVRRSMRTKVKHNYSELNDGAENGVVLDKSIVVDYVKMLKKAHCEQHAAVPLRIKGEELTLSFLSECGFRTPMIVDTMDALDMKMPPSSITVNRIKELVGSTRVLDVMEVPTQAEVDPKWTMEQWAEYYHTPVAQRQRILNVISLEISKTPLSAQVRAPRIVREIDWIDKVWPHRWKVATKYPQVQVYCLMSVMNAYTDFHIDFGGSSVWYHVVKGKKIFYLIPPEKENLEKYSTWSSSPRQSKVWFGNLVPHCYEAHVLPGQTFFIPTGWIHAVFTPEDSLVFGGNFLHGYNCRQQLEIYDIETTTHVPEKFRFPLFRQLIWFAALNYVDTMKEKGINAVDRWELDSAHAIMETLDVWLADSAKGYKDVPTKIRNPEALLSELHILLDRPADKSGQLQVKISKDELVKMGAADILKDVGENDLRIAETKQGKKGRPKKGTTAKTTPKGTPSSSPLQSPSTPSTPSSSSSTSPSVATHTPPFDDSSSRFQPIAKPEQPRSNYQFSQHNSPSPSSSGYPPYSQSPYSNGHSDSFPKHSNTGGYAYPPFSSPAPTSYKSYPPPANPRSVPPPPSRNHFSDLMHLTNAAESIEKDSAVHERDYSRYSAGLDYNYEQHYNSTPPSRKYYENGNYYNSPSQPQHHQHVQQSHHHVNSNSGPKYSSYTNSNSNGNTLTFINTNASQYRTNGHPPSSNPPPQRTTNHPPSSPYYPQPNGYPNSHHESYRPPPTFNNPHTITNGYHKDTSNVFGRYPEGGQDFKSMEEPAPIRKKGSLSFILNSRESDEEYSDHSEEEEDDERDPEEYLDKNDEEWQMGPAKTSSNTSQAKQPAVSSPKMTAAPRVDPKKMTARQRMEQKLKGKRKKV